MPSKIDPPPAPVEKLKTKTSRDRQRVYAAMRDAGETVAGAGVLAGYSAKSTSHLYANIEPKRRKGLFSSLSALDPLAQKAVAKIIRGKQVGDAEPPKSSDILRACEMIKDRTEPKVQKIEQTSRSVSLELSAEERDQIIKSLMDSYASKV